MEKLYPYSNILMAVKNIWFEVNLFVKHGVDFESNLPYARLNGERRVAIVTESYLSKPLIVGIDNPFIWFISIPHESKFNWLTEHIN